MRLSLVALAVTSSILAVAAAGCVSDDGCSALDNFCADPWELVYCDENSGLTFSADCNVACTADPAVYGPTCGGSPGVAGDCDPAGGLCACSCEDTFDRCVDDVTVRYTRQGDTFDVDCVDYCGGSCDPDTAACAC